MERRMLVVGNWKMNGLRKQLGEVEAIGKIAASYPAVEVGLCLPATLIAAGSGRAGAAFIGAQDCHENLAGAHTGCLSAAMLKDAGADQVIVGHSERRMDQNESNAQVSAKAQAAYAQELKVILCLGESLQTRDAGGAIPFVLDQLAASLPEGASANWLSVAYEPIWAIGTGRIPAMEQIAEMHEAIRGKIADLLGMREAMAIRVLYGGSVNAENAAEIFALEDVDGGLVGGASLNAAKFGPVIAAAS